MPEEFIVPRAFSGREDAACDPRERVGDVSDQAPERVAKVIAKVVDSASWSADGTAIAYLGFKLPGLHVLELSTGRDHTVTLRPNVGRGGSGCTDLDWKQARVR
jgi:hypothetical protein